MEVGETPGVTATTGVGDPINVGAAIALIGSGASLQKLRRPILQMAVAAAPPMTPIMMRNSRR